MTGVIERRETTTNWASVAVVLMLGASAICLAAAPLILPDSYSWTEHTTSEAAGAGRPVEENK